MSDDDPAKEFEHLKGTSYDDLRAPGKRARNWPDYIPSVKPRSNYEPPKESKVTKNIAPAGARPATHVGDFPYWNSDDDDPVVQNNVRTVEEAGDAQ